MAFSECQHLGKAFIGVDVYKLCKSPLQVTADWCIAYVTNLAHINHISFLYLI